MNDDLDDQVRQAGRRAAPPAYSDVDDARLRPDRGSPPSTPRWVYVFGIIAAVLVVLFIVLHVSGHGMGGH
ncbi:MAG: hypothetical protein M3072_16370 [Candidatus Dormibacteraeota bacterium]|nr:hypothetical protein [Candidatus Dormibacteraeota bacterium]